MTIAPSTHVSDIVTAEPATIAVFQRHRIEFCCAGHVSLQVVCENEGLDLGGMLEELATATQPFHETRDWLQAPLPELVSHIQEAYHRPLYEELPRLAGMLAKVVSRHGDRMPETLLPLEQTFSSLERDLTFHMRREDAVLFPAILRLASLSDERPGPHPLLGPISAMQRDHAEADDALAAMRRVTSGYQLPDNACPTFRGLYYGLRDLEYRMDLHVHLENDILFPRVLALGRSGAAAGA
jgi:regulator of cell morphogenesis and NO signaling